MRASTPILDPALTFRPDGDDLPDPQDPRSPYEIDRARIIHSAAFRRLQGKTQVFGIGEGDFYRTRLTHSMEAAQIGKGLALHLNAAQDANLSPELVEAACLAHDLGHPPFGHNGEKALQRCMWEHGGFESNAQMIRIVSRLEPKRRGHGLNLTRATLDALLKYPWPYDQAQASPDRVQKCFYAEDLPLIRWIRPHGVHAEERSLESQVMEWADDVAYSVHDLEDGLVAGFIDEDGLRDEELLADLLPLLVRRLEKLALARPDAEAMREVLDRIVTEYEALRSSYEAGARRALTSRLIHRFVTAVSVVPSEREAPYDRRLEVPAHARLEVETLKLVVQRLVIEDPRVVTMEWKGRTLVRRLFEELREAPSKLLPEPYRSQLRVKDAPPERIVCDYLAGMTDAHAMRLYSRMLEPSTGGLYDIL